MNAETRGFFFRFIGVYPRPSAAGNFFSLTFNFICVIRVIRG